MDRLIVISVLMMFTLASQAQIITPREKVGKLKVQLSEKIINHNLQHFQIKFISQDGKKTQIENFDDVYSVAKGEGCLSFYAYKKHSSHELYNWQKCGITIKAKKTTTIQLSLVNFNWQLSKVKVDIGPKLFFTFKSDEVGIKHKGFDMNNVSKNSAVLPYGDFKVAYLNVDTKQKKSFFTVNQSEINIDITPFDTRAEINVKRSEKVFPSPRFMNRYSGNVKELIYGYRHKPIVDSRTVLHSSLLYHSHKTEYTYEISRIVLPAKKDGHVLKAYPANNNQKEYMLNVNNIPIRIDLESGEKEMIELQTLNIGLIDGRYEGEYQIIQEDMSLDSGERTLQYAITCDVLEDACAKLSKNLYFKTQTAVEVPFGYLYKVEAYLSLSNNSRDLQDVINVDLR